MEVISAEFSNFPRLRIVNNGSAIMSKFEIVKIEATHDDPEMSDQIDSLMEGDLNKWSMNYFQDLSKLGYIFYLYFKKNGPLLTHPPHQILCY